MNQILLSVIAEGGPGNTGPDFGKASPVGLLVIVLLVIATLFLVRSMNQQLKKVPKSFDRDHPELDQAAWVMPGFTPAGCNASTNRNYRVTYRLKGAARRTDKGARERTAVDGGARPPR